MSSRKSTKNWSRPISGHLQNIGAGKGEYTLVIQPPNPVDEPDRITEDQAIITEFGRITETGAVARRVAIKQLAKKFGRGAREVYALIEGSRDSGE